MMSFPFTQLCVEEMPVDWWGFQPRPRDEGEDNKHPYSGTSDGFFWALTSYRGRGEHSYWIRLFPRCETSQDLIIMCPPSETDYIWYGIWYMIYHLWFMMFDVWCVMYDIWFFYNMLLHHIIMIFVLKDMWAKGGENVFRWSEDFEISPKTTC